MASLANSCRKMSEELSKSENGLKVLEFVQKKKINGYSTSREYTVLEVMDAFIRNVKKPFSELTEADIVNYVPSIKGNESTRTVRMTVLKMFFRSIGKSNIVDFISTKIIPKDIKSSELLTQNDVSKLIELAQQKKYKALISILWESNCRIGELLNVKLKDVEFDSDCCRIQIQNEKTSGSRQLVLFDSKFYIQEYLKNEFEFPDNKEAFLFPAQHPLNPYKQLSADGVNNTLQMLGVQADIKKKMHCHLFRHSGSTRDTNLGYNEMQLRFKNGWSGRSDMPSRYVHLCNGDIENKERQIRGLSENKIQLVVNRICESCNFSNPFNASYCINCGYPISNVAKSKLNEIGLSLWNMMKANDNMKNKAEEIREAVREMAVAKK